MNNDKVTRVMTDKSAEEIAQWFVDTFWPSLPKYVNEKIFMDILVDNVGAAREEWWDLKDDDETANEFMTKVIASMGIGYNPGEAYEEACSTVFFEECVHA